MGMYKYLDEIMGNKLSGIHTAYLAKVLSVSGDTAKIQPLGLNQHADGTTSNQSVLTQVPIAQHVRHFTLVKQSMSISDTWSGGGSISPATHPTGDNVGHLKIEPIRAGDIVVCICCERNISEAKKGVNSITPAGRHDMSDSVIIGLL